MKNALIVLIAIILGISAISVEAAKGGKIKNIRESIAREIDDSKASIRRVARHELILEAGKDCERKRNEAKPGEDPELLICKCVAKRVTAKLSEDKKRRLEKLSTEINEIEESGASETDVKNLKLLYKAYEINSLTAHDDLVQECLEGKVSDNNRFGLLLEITFFILIALALISIVAKIDWNKR